MEHADMTCKAASSRFQTLRTLLLLTREILGAVTTSVGWRLPEVNIGIVCANAPIIRPLYLFFRGQLASQKVSRTTAVSKEGISWPSDTTRFGLVSPTQKEQLSDGGLSLEMGLNNHERGEGRQDQEDLPHSPLKERPYFTWDK